MKQIKPFKSERFYTDHQSLAEYSLSSSDCESLTVADLLCLNSQYITDFCNLKLGYNDTRGTSNLRRVIAALYKDIDEENIIVHCGGQEAIYLFLQSFLSPGDHIIVQTPCYQSYLTIPLSMGCSVTEWEMTLDREWKVDIAGLNELINPTTKLICINSPHNPTGYHFTQEELDEIIEIARINHIAIFSDEVFRFLEFDEQHRLRSVAEQYENGFSLGAISKSFGLAGLRIGWISTRRTDIIRRLTVLKEFTTICNNSVSELLARIALKNRTTLLKQNLQLVRRNIAVAEQFFCDNKSLFEFSKPKAGPVSFVKILHSNKSEAFVRQLLSSKKVLLLQGELFNNPGFFRIGFGKINFLEAFGRFREFVDDKLFIEK